VKQFQKCSDGRKAKTSLRENDGSADDLHNISSGKSAWQTAAPAKAESVKGKRRNSSNPPARVTARFDGLYRPQFFFWRSPAHRSPQEVSGLSACALIFHAPGSASRFACTSIAAALPENRRPANLLSASSGKNGSRNSETVSSNGEAHNSGVGAQTISVGTQPRTVSSALPMGGRKAPRTVRLRVLQVKLNQELTLISRSREVNHQHLFAQAMSQMITHVNDAAAW